MRNNRVAMAALSIPLVYAIGCAGSNTSTSLPFGGGKTVDTTSAAAGVAPKAIVRAAAARNATINNTICMAGSSYSTVKDDEFATDTTLSTVPGLIATAPSAMWSTQFNFGRTNNAGIDDAYYADSSIFPNVNPFSLGGGNLAIVARPIPSSDLGNAALQGRNWTSGVLVGHPLTYGYVEVSAEMPNLQGFWPAPIWLLAANGSDGKGNGYAELDGAEIFGNSLPASTVQQTAIYNAAHTASDYVRTVMSQDPSTGFHTYGILWTSKYVSFFIDRKQTSPQYPNPATGPMNPIINLQVFTNHAWAPAPASNASKSMYLKYYRWYQTTGAACGSPTPTPSPIPSAAPSPIPSATPSPIRTVAPSPTPSASPIPTGTTPPSGSPKLVQSSGPATSSSWGYVSPLFKTTPKTGDLLVAVGELVTDLSPLTSGWTELPGAGGYLHVFTGVVGKNGLLPSMSYSLGATAGGIIDVFDIAGASTTVAPSMGADPAQYQSTFSRSLAIPAAGGMTLTMWGAAYWQGFTAKTITAQLPASQADSAVLTDIGGLNLGGGSYSLVVKQMTTSPYQAPQPFSVSVKLTGSGGVPTGNGNILWIPAAGGP